MSSLGELKPATLNRDEATIFRFAGPKVPIGQRNDYLTGKGPCLALRSARFRQGDYALILMDLNQISEEYFDEPLPEKQLINIAKWASEIQLSGNNRVGLSSKNTRACFQLPIGTASLFPKNRIGHLSLFLFCELCRHHPPHHVFCMTDKFINLSIGRRNPTKGRDANRRDHATIKGALVDAGLLVQISKPIRKKKHAVFGFGPAYLEAQAI